MIEQHTCSAVAALIDEASAQDHLLRKQGA